MKEAGRRRLSTICTTSRILTCTRTHAQKRSGTATTLYNFNPSKISKSHARTHAQKEMKEAGRNPTCTGFKSRLQSNQVEQEVLLPEDEDIAGMCVLV